MRLCQRFVRTLAVLPFLLGLVAIPCSPSPARGAEPNIEILLIGNSLIRGVKNPLKRMLKENGDFAKIKAHGPGIWSLTDHAESPRTAKIIASKPWDFVLLQEKSVGIANFELDEGVGNGYDAARTLHDIIVANSSAVDLLFMTWRERNTVPNSTLWELLRGTPGEDIGYVPIAFELDIGVAPVGWSIHDARLSDPSFEFYKGGKGRHLNSFGRYIGACVVFATVTGQSPRGAWAPPRFVKKFGPQVIDFLQTVAEQTVFGDPSTWNLPFTGGGNPD